MLVARPAFAQSQANPQPPVPPAADAATSPATSQAQAGAPEADDRLSDIIVTAQRRSENLQAVPIAVTAISSRQLTAAGVTSLQNLRVLVPGLSFSNIQNNVTPRLRGIGSSTAESFVKLGIIPGDGGAFLLQKIVGISKAAELTFTGRTITPAEALACGLVSNVVPDAELLPRAQALAVEIAQNPPQALRMAKRLLREAQTARLESVLELSAAFQALAHATQDHKDRVAAAVDRLGGSK